MVGHYDHVDLFGPLWIDRCWILHLRQEAAKADSFDCGDRSLCFSLFHTQSLCNGHRRHDLDCRALAAERIVIMGSSIEGKCLDSLTNRSSRRGSAARAAEFDRSAVSQRGIT